MLQDMMTYRLYDRFSFCEKCASDNVKSGWKPIDAKFCPDCGEFVRHKPRIHRAAFIENIVRY